MLAAAALTASFAAVTAAADDVEPAKALGAKRLVKCDGKVATKVGTPKKDVIIGTARRDIIAGLGGNDIILGRGGNDVICGGAGNDRIAGGAGHDKLLGQTGRDRLFGLAGVDRLFGGQQNDFLAGQAGPDVLFGGAGFDRLDGGIGVDACYQNTGHGPHVRCELPKSVFAPPAPPAPPAPTPKTLAIAYSDLVQDGQFGSGDVLIAKLVDTDLDGTPSPGDTIVMDRYPEDTDAATFGKWDVTSHVITSVKKARADHLLVKAESGWHGWWTAVNGIEQYREAVELSDIYPASAGALSYIKDAIISPDRDSIRIQDGSPSQPPTSYHTDHETTADGTDDPFVDVDLFYTP